MTKKKTTTAKSNEIASEQQKTEQTETTSWEIVDTLKKSSEDLDVIQAAQKKIKKKYEEFSSLLLEWKNEAFHILWSIRTLEKIYGDVWIPLDPIKTSDDFITKEMRDNFIQRYLKNTWDFEKLDFIYRLWMPTPEEQYAFVKAHWLRVADPNFEGDDNGISKFMERYGYVLNQEKASDLYTAIAEKTESAYGTVYRLSHDFGDRFWYLTINKKVAEILMNRRGKLHRNGKSVSHEELKKIISQEKTIYFYYQHSYYGTLLLWNKICIIENDKRKYVN